jgi:hypothetical protein
LLFKTKAYLSGESGMEENCKNILALGSGQLCG